jgi:glyoxylase-like metal-dependent hydrolase (beta-lactamase superfamily II)
VSDGSDLYFHQLHVGQMANLAYVVGSRSARQAVIVDPAWSVDALLDRAESDDMEVVGALVTHYHQDHVGGSIFGMDIEGVDRLLTRKPVPIHVNVHEADGLKQITGASESDLSRCDAGDTLTLGQIRIRLLHTPGHTPGSQCFLVEEEGQPGRLVSGDTLFLGSCGRVDLPGADPEAMYRSLNETLKALPEETLVFPGHLYSEPQGTIGQEKQSNPMLRVTGLEQFLMFMGVSAP